VARALALGRSPNDPRRGVAILAYHNTEPDADHPWYLDFKGQMALVEDLGYRVVSLDRVLKALLDTEPPREPTLAVTFDDGWASNLDVAFPELATRRWPATVFVTTSYIGRRPYLGAPELGQLIELGIEVGNHSHSHSDLTSLDSDAILADLAECSRRIEDLTGQKPIHFCYPSGSYNAKVRAVVSRSGMASACTGRIGFNRPGTDPFQLKRITLDAREGPSELWTRLAGGYDFLDFKQRLLGRTAV